MKSAASIDQERLSARVVLDAVSVLVALLWLRRHSKYPQTPAATA